MPALKDRVIKQAMDHVQLVYVDRATANWWNARRNDSDTVTFTGHYWTKGHEEGGPFKTKSAAIRDAYYRFVRRQDPPTTALHMNRIPTRRPKQRVILRPHSEIRT
jgi:hypothetical protein